MILINKEFITKCMNKDRLSQSKLYEHCFHLLMPVCYKYMKQEEYAREVYNQIFLKLIFSLNKYDSEKEFSKWAKTIAINTLIDEYRKKERVRKVIDENIEIELTATYKMSETVHNESIKNEEQERVEIMLNKLPPVSRKVFSMFAMEGFSHQEIGEMLNISIGTSKWHVSNAREILKKLVTNVILILFI